MDIAGEGGIMDGKREGGRRRGGQRDLDGTTSRGQKPTDSTASLLAQGYGQNGPGGQAARRDCSSTGDDTGAG